MEDLISFEDLVVQPCNSYFNLEKELHEVKSRLSLMETRLKYLESERYPKKRNDRTQRFEEIIKRKEETNDKIVNKVCIEENEILLDNIVFQHGGYQGMENYLSKYNLIKELILSKRFLLTLLYYNNDLLNYFLKPNSLKIEKLKLYLTYYFGIIDRIIELNFKCKTIEVCGNTFYRKNFQIKNLQKYCIENKIELKVI